ncbi:hypothetical protein IKE86_02070 [Candidatus Saccharibacteria bacterium]|nr:hypothetical protein [Candidatus Saccharibacteria bacterium]
MQTKTTAVLGNIKSRNLYRKLLGGSLASLAVFLFVYALVPTLVSEANAAVNLSFNVTWRPTALALDPDYGNGSILDAGHGDVLFGTIIPTSIDAGATSAANGNVGTLKILKKTIGIESTGKYYTVYISTNSPTSNDLQIEGDSGFSIPAIGSAFTSTPSKFTNYAWGFSVPGVENTGIASAPTYASESIYSNKLNEELTYANAESIYKNVTWSAVPTLSAPQQIWKATTTDNDGFGGENGDTDANHFNVYYGVMVNNDVLAGTYENQIVYTALASANSLDDAVSNNIITEKSFGADDGTTPFSMTLAFDLAESADTGLITSQNIEVFVVKHGEMVAANYDVSQLGPQSKTCTVTDFEINNNRAALTCDMPITGEITDDGSASTALAEDDALIAATGTGILTSEERAALAAAASAGRYDFWIKVSPYNYNYITKISDGTATGTREAFAYVGLQSTYPKYEDGEIKQKPYVTEMQQVSNAICKNTNMWGNQVSPDARIFDYRGISGGNQLVVDIMTTTTDPDTGEETEVVDGEATSEASAAIGIGTFALIDSRDGNSYSVRRLANGSCHMVQNLNLNLANFDETNPLTSTDTNLVSMETWDPSASETAAYHEGNGYYYYNWYAATADSIGVEETGTAQNTVCPKNWTITGNWYQLLSNNYNAGNGSGVKNQKIPLSLTPSGYYSFATNEIRYSYVYLWSRKSESTTSAQSLGGAASNPNVSLPRAQGHGVRCFISSAS